MISFYEVYLYSIPNASGNAYQQNKLNAVNTHIHFPKIIAAVKASKKTHEWPVELHLKTSRLLLISLIKKYKQQVSKD